MSDTDFDRWLDWFLDCLDDDGLGLPEDDQ
jgi:hypothetical protein